MKNPFEKNQPPDDAILLEHNRLLEASTRLGKASGERNTPKPEENLISYFSALTSGYQGLISSHVTKTISTTSNSVSEFQQTAVKDKIKRLNGNLADYNEKLRKALMTREEMPKDIDHGKHIGLHIFILIISLFESFFTAKAFAVFSHGSNLAQLFVLAGLTAVFILLPQACVWVIRATEDKPNKWLMRIGFFVIIIATFVTLGILRSIFLQNINITTLTPGIKASSTIELKPWYFAILNLFFLCLSSYACLQIPDHIQKSKAKNERDATAKIEELERKIRDTEDQIMRLPDTYVNSENTRQQNIAVAKEKAERIRSLYFQSVSQYIESNLAWRSDYENPFDFDKLPDLKMPNF